MAEKITNIAVLGAGVMGAQIAGHLANCGFGALLLDISGEIVEGSIGKLKKAKPPALFTPGVLKSITTGTIEKNLADACACDWIIEVVPEKIEIKKDLYEKIEKLLKKDIIISSNTSGISLSILTDGRSARFKESFMITHFFNPVRYMKLVELVTGLDTDPEKVAVIRSVLSESLGKGVVAAKDTPGFIANRIGIYTVMNTINKTYLHHWPIDLVDTVMGKATSFASSGIFRTADIVGLDTLMHAAENTYKMCANDPFRETMKPHPAVLKMIDEGRLGTKSGAGFYKKEGKEIFVVDTARDEVKAEVEVEYRLKKLNKFESINMAKKAGSPAARVQAMFQGDDEAASIAKELITDILVYVDSVAGEISDSLIDIDNAMKWGYNWQLGPFELWEAVGAGVVKGKVLPRIERPPDNYSIKSFKEKNGTVAKNSEASLVDIGDGVICCEFHSKMNAIGPEIIAMLNQGVDFLDAGKYAGMVVANDADNFSVGANIFMVAMAISNKSWDQIEALVKAFQDVGQRMRFSKRPVVAAPAGMTLGGGCEVCLAAGNVVPAIEAYMGQVELGVGLIPAAGGCKNLILNMEKRHLDKFDPKNQIWYAAKDGGPFPKVRDAFELIALAKVAVSGMDAAGLGFISKESPIVLDREKLVIRAKEYLLKLAENYVPPEPREDILLPGRGGEMTLVSSAKAMNKQGIASDYDVVLASNLAHVLTGGNIATAHKVSEQDILDLEREVFLKLCGMEKTVERIQHMLTTGKPLRN